MISGGRSIISRLGKLKRCLVQIKGFKINVEPKFPLKISEFLLIFAKFTLLKRVSHVFLTGSCVDSEKEFIEGKGYLWIWQPKVLSSGFQLKGCGNHHCKS